MLFQKIIGCHKPAVFQYTETDCNTVDGCTQRTHSRERGKGDREHGVDFALAYNYDDWLKKCCDGNIVGAIFHKLWF